MELKVENIKFATIYFSLTKEKKLSLKGNGKFHKQFSRTKNSTLIEL